MNSSTTFCCRPLVSRPIVSSLQSNEQMKATLSMSHASSIFPNILTLMLLRPSENPLERVVLIQIFLLIGILTSSPVFFIIIIFVIKR